MRSFASLVLVAACSGGAQHVTGPAKPAATDTDPDGPHRAAIASLFQPLVDHEVVSGVVVGIYDAGKVEIYGFGKGPGGKPPNGHTLFELGSITKVYTGLLFADSVQRHEVELDTPASELLPPGVTMPTRDHVPITLRELALHSSGLPRMPPSVKARPGAPDPYGHYPEDALYADLLQTQLENPPGHVILYSHYGTGLLGFVLGRKIGGGFGKALATRVLGPLGAHDTFLEVPPAAKARLATGTNDDLAPVAPWRFDALAGAGGLVSSAHDLVALIDAELEAAAGSKQTLRPAMRLTQEDQLEGTGVNEGLGWQVDSHGRYWHSSDTATAGFHAFIGFDPKTRRGVVILAATNVSVVDHMNDDLYQIIAGEPVKTPTYPVPTQLAKYAGTYDFSGEPLAVAVHGTRLYVEGQGAKVRLVPISDHEFWLEELGSIAIFQREGEDIKRILFVVGDRQMTAQRVEKGAAPPAAPAPPPKP